MKNLGLLVSDKILENCKICKILFCDPVTFLCNQSQPFEQFWKRTIKGLFLWSLVKIQRVVSEEKLFKEIKEVAIRRLTSSCASFLHACRSKYLECLCRKLTKHMFFVAYLVVGFHSHIHLSSFNINTNIFYNILDGVGGIYVLQNKCFKQNVVVFLTFFTIYLIWNPKPDKDYTCTTIHYHEGDTPLRTACRHISALRTAYCHVLASRTAYRFNNKTTIFGNFIYIKKIKW